MCGPSRWDCPKPPSSPISTSSPSGCAARYSPHCPTRTTCTPCSPSRTSTPPSANSPATARKSGGANAFPPSASPLPASTAAYSPKSSPTPGATRPRVPCGARLRRGARLVVLADLRLDGRGDILNAVAVVPYPRAWREAKAACSLAAARLMPLESRAASSARPGTGSDAGMTAATRVARSITSATPGGGCRADQAAPRRRRARARGPVRRAPLRTARRPSGRA